MPRQFTPIGRVSFCNVFRPSTFDPDRPIFEITLLWPKSTDLSQLKADIKAAAEKEWGDKMPPRIHLPIRDGGEKDHLDGYGEDVVFARFWSKTKPQILAADGKTFLTEGDGMFYSGCWARVSYDAFAGKQERLGPYVSLGLGNIQKARDDEAFGGGKQIRADEEFDAIDGEEEISDAAADMFG